MEPRIQYAKTKDGVSIAFYTLGEGMPLVCMPRMPWSHIQLEWQVPRMRRFIEQLAEERMLIRYDCRGTGLSDRDALEFSLDSQVLDLEAVVDRLKLVRFALFAPVYSGPVAISYAERHPERASHILLWCSAVRGADFTAPSQLRALSRLADADWELFTESATHYVYGYSDAERAHEAAVFLRECVSPEAYRAFRAATAEVDVAALLSQVRAPTLVLHRRQATYPEVGCARELASRIPDARLLLLEGTSQQPQEGDTEAVLAAIDEFLGEGEEAAGAEPPDAGAFRTVLFTDVEGSTALTDRLGDARARKLLREHESMIREALKTHGGSEVKTLGDGFMTSFSSATKALECAIAMQRAFAERNESAEEPIKIRIGLNAGEPIAEEEDLFGTAVILAARIAAKAEGGEILASEAVRQIVAGKKFPFSDLGETALRGFEDRVHIYQVSWREG
jgi:class 3 adenylate cyclase